MQTKSATFNSSCLLMYSVNKAKTDITKTLYAYCPLVVQWFDLVTVHALCQIVLIRWCYCRCSVAAACWRYPITDITKIYESMKDLTNIYIVVIMLNYVCTLLMEINHQHRCIKVVTICLEINYQVFS